MKIKAATEDYFHQQLTLVQRFTWYQNLLDADAMLHLLKLYPNSAFEFSLFRVSVSSLQMFHIERSTLRVYVLDYVKTRNKKAAGQCDCFSH